MARDIQSLNDWILVQCFYVPYPYRDGYYCHDHSWQD